MRPFRQDITGTTDASGNVSIPIKLPTTGEWHGLKFALGLPSPAEWAILISGRPLTYGRGRRVTLGPELIQDGETVTVSVTGGPPTALVDGMASGTSGSPEEIMANFTPAPNTIALDANSVPQLLATAPAGTGTLAAPLTEPLPTGAIAIGYAVRGSTTNLTAVSIVGNETTNSYVLDSANFATVPFAVLLNPADVKIVLNVQSVLARPAVDFFVWTVPTAVWVQNRTQTPLFVQQPTGGIIAVSEQFGVPGPWQAAATSRGGTATPGALATDFTIKAAPGAGVALHLFDMLFDTNSAAAVDLSLWDGASANNVNVARLRQRSTATPMRYNGSGAGLGTNSALVGRLDAGDAGTTVTWSVATNQG